MDLFAQLGFSSDDPQIAAAREDVTEYEAMIAALVQARKDAGISQQQVADALHTSQPVISELERLAGNPTVTRLMEYARAVGQRLCFKIGDPNDFVAENEKYYQASARSLVVVTVARFDDIYQENPRRHLSPPAMADAWQQRSTSRTFQA